MAVRGFVDAGSGSVAYRRRGTWYVRVSFEWQINVLGQAEQNVGRRRSTARELFSMRRNMRKTLIVDRWILLHPALPRSLEQKLLLLQRERRI